MLNTFYIFVKFYEINDRIKKVMLAAFRNTKRVIY